MAVAFSLHDAVSGKTDLSLLYDEARGAANALRRGNCKGSEFLGWLNLPETYDREEVSRIEKAAGKIRGNSQALVVIGIGGSYLGARAALEFIRSPNYNLLKKDTPDIYFAGCNLSSDSLFEIAELVKNRDFSVNVISKSGSTIEPAIAFRFFKRLLEEKYGKKEAAARIFATTDKARGILKDIADREGYETFVVPDDIGGRYSVLTAVGLLPMAAAGISLSELFAGAAAAMAGGASDDPSVNLSLAYAAVRNDFYRQGKTTEIFSGFSPCLHYVGEWWKQLFGESEGKNGKGLLPALLTFTADLHSMGQYVQDGPRTLFETIVEIGASDTELEVLEEDGNSDGLNFLAGRSLDYINRQALLATARAHKDGGVPVLRLTIDKKDAWHFGYLVYFFELACGISGTILGVNPFDQPGVEAYKLNMFALLDKPGYEARKAELLAKTGSGDI